jgi:hypothetical protein
MQSNTDPTSLLIAESPQPSKEWEGKIELAIEEGRLSADEWCDLRLDVGDPIFGTPDNCIVRPLTKNLILAAEKSFKTTFTMRLMLALSCGQTVFPQLPVPVPRRVLYIHGELSPPEIQDRTRAAMEDLLGSGFYQACNHRVNLCDAQGQEHLRDILDRQRGDLKPEVLVLDPWQEFIAGFDENAFKDMSLATKFVEKVIHDYELTVVIVAHEGKGSKKGVRGNSLIAGWRDTLISVKRPEQGNQVNVTIDPRWAPGVPSFSLTFKDGTLWPADPTSRRFSGQAEEIRQCVATKGGECTKAEVGQFLNLKDDSLRKALNRAEDKGAISIHDDVVTLPEGGRTAIPFLPPGRNGHPPIEGGCVRPPEPEPDNVCQPDRPLRESVAYPLDTAQTDRQTECGQRAHVRHADKCCLSGVGQPTASTFL